MANVATHPSPRTIIEAKLLREQTDYWHHYKRHAMGIKLTREALFPGYGFTTRQALPSLLP